MSTINTQTLEINRVPFSRMLKSEMADYAENAAAIVSNYETESDLIGQVFGLLEKQRPQIELLRISYGVDTERLRVQKLKADMMLTISALKLRVRSLKRSNLELDLHILENAITKHLRYLDTVKNDNELTQKIKGFLDLVDKNKKVYDKLTEFNLINEVDSIKMALADVNAAMKNRVRLLSKRSKEPTRKIMKGLHNAVNNLFKAVEVSHLVGFPTSIGEEGEGAVASDFTDLINELSQLSDMYNKSIAIRLANNQRKLDEEKEQEEGAEGAEGEETESTDGEDGTESTDGEDGTEGAEGTEGTEPMATAMHINSTLDDEESKIKPFAVMVNLGNKDEQDVADEEDNEEDAGDYE